MWKYRSLMTLIPRSTLERTLGFVRLWQTYSETGITTSSGITAASRRGVNAILASGTAHPKLTTHTKAMNRRRFLGLDNDQLTSFPPPSDVCYELPLSSQFLLSPARTGGVMQNLCIGNNSSLNVLRLD